VSICSRGGSLLDDTHAHEQLLAGWDPFGCHQEQGAPLPLPQWLRRAHDDTAASICSWGGPLPGLDDDDAISSSSSAPVLEEARNCGSSQMQELLHDGRRRVYRYPLTHGSRTRGLHMQKPTEGRAEATPTPDCSPLILQDGMRVRVGRDGGDSGLRAPLYAPHTDGIMFIFVSLFSIWLIFLCLARPLIPCITARALHYAPITTRPSPRAPPYAPQVIPISSDSASHVITIDHL